jgi:hypothetical protein
MCQAFVTLSSLLLPQAICFLDSEMEYTEKKTQEYIRFMEIAALE